jgi:hypothetical protein
MPTVEIISLIYRSNQYLSFISEQLKSEYCLAAGFDVSTRIVANDPVKEVADALPTCGHPFDIYNDKLPQDYYLNRVYRCWNFAGMSSKADIVCFVNSDMAFSRDWLSNLLKHRNGKNIVTSRLVESGRMPSGTHGFGKNFGMHPHEFRRPEWEAYAETIKKDSLLPGGLFMPVIIDRDVFIQSGGYPEGNIYSTGVGDFGKGRYVKSGDDFFFNTTLRQKFGLKHVTAFDSVVYHFQSGEMLLPGDSV